MPFKNDVITNGANFRNKGGNFSVQGSMNSKLFIKSFLNGTKVKICTRYTKIEMHGKNKIMDKVTLISKFTSCRSPGINELISQTHVRICRRI